MLNLLLNCFIFATTITAFSDPYEWLETDSLETQAWVKEQRAESAAYFNKLNSDEIEEDLRTITAQETWWLPESHDRALYLCKRGAQENKAVLIRILEGKTEVLVDPNDMEEDVMLVGFSLSPNGHYLAYGLSLAGSDQLEWHLLDLETHKEMPDCLKHIQFSKVCWDNSSELLYYVRDSLAVYAHKLGTNSKHDALLYKPNEDLFVYSPQMVCDGQYLLVQERRGVTSRVGIRLIDLEKKQNFELIPPGNFDLCPVGSFDDEILFITDEECSRGTMMAISTHTKEKRTVIEGCDNLLYDATIVDDKLACCYYDNACAHVKLFDSSGEYFYSLPLPGMGTVELDSSNSTLFYTYTDFYTPVEMYAHDVKSGENAQLYASQLDNSDLVTEQVWYASKDGTRVPLFLTHQKDLEIDKHTPVLLTGYGGFALPYTPSFRSYQYAWVKEGGVFAVPNIRGGKEFGRAWYEDGVGHKKQNGFDDFIAAAEWLVDNQVGSTESLGIFGTSNGGLLMGTALTQRPDLFGAAVVNKGVLDMLNFHRYTVGRFWTCDYGNPENDIDRAYLLTYSPYHNVVEGERYPATLVNTADRDDRVVPMHSYKFYAALKGANGSENPVLLRLEEACGHGGTNSQEQEVSFGRDLLTFFYEELAIKKAETISAT